jgi:hypothetical protein
MRAAVSRRVRRMRRSAVSRRVVPLLEGVNTAAQTAGPESEGGNVEGERDVGVGGTDAGLGAEREVAVHGSEGVKER